MSKFFSKKYEKLEPYTPGEQPQDMQYIKLNTNESPFPPHPAVAQAVAGEIDKLRLYSDPDSKALTAMLAQQLGVDTDQVMLTNGSDDVLNFAFMAFCDKDHPAIFPDITYGFYKVFADLNGVPKKEIPLKADFSIDLDDYKEEKGVVFIANPNAPTGLALPVSEIEKLVQANPNRVVVIDEAYVDFGGESCIPLTKKYENLLVTQTFSKSRAMAGARLGFGVAGKGIIEDLKRIKYSTNPYNVNRVTAAAGTASIQDEEYFQACCSCIIANREWTAERLRELGFAMTDSQANFLFVRHDKIGGEELYLRLKEAGILVRHFSQERIKDYNRITVGSRKEMEILVKTIGEML